MIELLRQKGADVRYHDPCAPHIRHNGCEMAGEPNLDAALRLGSPLPLVGNSPWSQDRLLAAADGAVAATEHSCYDWAAIKRKVNLVVDTRHAVFGMADGDCMQVRVG